jgi:hypothetical protein
MSRRIEVRGPAEFEHAIEHQSNRMYAGLVRVCRNAASYGRSKAMQLSRAIGFRASGTYERSFVVVPTPDGAILANSAEHAGIVELGRRPGRRPPPVQVILLWMQEKGMIPKMSIPSQRTFVAKAMKIARSSGLDAGTRRRIRGKVEENARQQRLTEREQFIMFAWRRAAKIAKNIGIHGMKPHWVLGRTTADIKRFVRAELPKLRLG